MIRRGFHQSPLPHGRNYNFDLACSFLAHFFPDPKPSLRAREQLKRTPSTITPSISKMLGTGRPSLSFLQTPAGALWAARPSARASLQRPSAPGSPDPPPGAGKGRFGARRPLGLIYDRVALFTAESRDLVSRRADIAVAPACFFQSPGTAGGSGLVFPGVSLLGEETGRLRERASLFAAESRDAMRKSADSMSERARFSRSLGTWRRNEPTR